MVDINRIVLKINFHILKFIYKGVTLKKKKPPGYPMKLPTKV